jgi:hypothetical protein
MWTKEYQPLGLEIWKYRILIYLKAHAPSASVVNLTLLYITSEAVIPAKAGIQFINTGFRVKPGMTNKGKGFLTHHTSI